MGALLIIGALGLAGLPPFGTALGKALSEDAASTAGYGWAPFLFVAVSALTGGAVLRVAGRIYFSMGPRPQERSQVRASGNDDQEPRLQRLPWTMITSIVVLLVGGFIIGLLPGVHSVANRAAATFIDSTGYTHQALYKVPERAVATTASNWTGIGLALGFASSVLACCIALAGLYGERLTARLPILRQAYGPVNLLHRLHSGHVGDYVAWMMMGLAVLAGFIGLPLR